MKIALLNPVFWPEVRRGSERFARDLADGLLARGHRVRLITSHPGRSTTTTEDGLEVVRLRRPPGPWRLSHVPGSALALRRGGDEVAHALYPADALAGQWAHLPVVLSGMGIPDRAWLAGQGAVRRAVLGRALARAAAVVALSDAAARAFVDVLGVRPRVIAPGVDLAAFTPGGRRADAPTILCAADHAEPRKRVGLLLAAFARVRARVPSARLVLARSPRAPDPAAPGVEVRDLDDRAALVEANREAWVAALPSTGEAFGLVALEALACGTPVVVAESGALPEVVDSDAIGRRFAGDDPDALCRALLDAFSLRADPVTPRACRARAEAFPVDATVAAYEALYRAVLAPAAVAGATC